ncbi:MAG: transposase [Pseudomonadales bacterium]|nr:transposase [Pseudomonadales bacterium]
MELTSIINRYHDRFKKHYADRITAEQRQAVHAMLGCRAGQYGDILLHCSTCHTNQSQPKSCGHRSCQRCQNHDTTRWLDRQRKKLLPVEYFMATFTLPYELRGLTWYNQKEFYSLLFQCAISTLKDFGINDKKLGADLGMTAVLHTHSRRLDYHPHVHIIVPGGCINKKRKQWKKLHGKYLFNEFALADVFRARFLVGLKDAGFACPDNTPKQWVVDCKHVGKGLSALKYLSRYLYRGVISDKNIICDDGTYATFRYQESKSGKFKERKLKGEVFLWLVLQHVLPKGFRRVRDYGFLHGNAQQTLKLVQWILKVLVGSVDTKIRPVFICAQCKHPLSIVGFRKRSWCTG